MNQKQNVVGVKKKQKASSLQRGTTGLMRGQGTGTKEFSQRLEKA